MFFKLSFDGKRIGIERFQVLSFAGDCELMENVLANSGSKCRVLQVIASGVPFHGHPTKCFVCEAKSNQSPKLCNYECYDLMSSLISVH